MRQRPRIFYFAPDWAPPSGGIRMIWRSVELLREAGFDAYVLNQERGFRPQWFKSAAPAQAVDYDFRPRREDFLVLPENGRSAYSIAPIIERRIIFCQGLYTVYQGFASTPDWRTWCREMICVSRTIDEFVRDVLRFDRRTLVPCYIDRALFHSEPKRMQIAYMPRKRRRDARFIRECFRDFAPELRRIPWVPIDGCSEEETAAILRQSTAFLSLSHLEGFGLPALEALASGCLVVGFHGGGGREYATEMNGDWIEEWDLAGCAQALARRLRDETTHPARVKAALATASEYGIKQTRASLIRFWSTRLNS